MTDDASPARNLVPAPGLYAWGAFACLRIVRFAMWCRVLSPHRALRITAPWSEAAVLAGLELPPRFFEVATEAGLPLPGAPGPSQL